MPATKKRDFFDSLPPYLGGKRKLLGTIFKEVAKHLDVRDWRRATFVDGFMGGGSVSIYAKAQFGQVISNDYSDRSAMIATAILTNNAVLLAPTDARLFLAGENSETAYAGSLSDWFIPGTAAVIDRGLAYADQVANPTKRAMLRLIAWRVLCNARPSGGDFTSRRLVERAMSGEIKVTGMSNARFAFRPPDIRDILTYVRYTNSGVFGGRLEFTQADAIEVSKEWGADVVYLDPPYAGDQSYEKFYHIADSVMAQRELPKSGDSPFSTPSKAADCIAEMSENIYRAGAKLLICSNSDEGLGREQQVEILSRHWDVYEVPVKHRHSFAGTRGNDANESGSTEVMIVGKRR